MPEAYLEHSWTSMIELFCKNSWRLKVVNYFRKKSSIIDFRLGFKYASAWQSKPTWQMRLTIEWTKWNLQKIIFKKLKWYHFKFFKKWLPKSLFGPFLNIFPQILDQVKNKDTWASFIYLRHLPSGNSEENGKTEEIF